MGNWLLYLILGIAVVTGLARFALEATKQTGSALEKVVKEKPLDPGTEKIVRTEEERREELEKIRERLKARRNIEKN